MIAQQEQERLLGAALWSPSGNLPVIRRAAAGSLLFEPPLAAIMDRIRPSDPDQASQLIEARLGIDLDEGEQASLERYTGGRVLRVWLVELETDGSRETPGTIEALVAEVVAARRDRVCRERMVDLATRLSTMASDPSLNGELPVKLERTLDEGRRVLADLSPTPTDAMSRAARSYQRMLESPSEEPPALLGDGLWRPGQLFLLHGSDGSRKSFAALHGCVALAQGRPWFGLPTRAGGVRVGYVSAEDPESLIIRRLGAIVAAEDADTDQVDENLLVVSPPAFTQLLDITTPEGAEMLDRFVADHQLDVVILDHLSRMHRLADERDLRPVTLPLIDLARRRGAGILLLHHDRKPIGDAMPGSDRGAARGDSRLTADCRLVANIFESRGGIVIRFRKSTGGARPDDIHLEHGPNGALQVTDAPQDAAAKAAANRATLLAAVVDAGPAGLDFTGARRVLPGVAERTCREYLRQLTTAEQVSRHGHTTRRRWIVLRQGSALPESLPELLPEMGRS